MKGIFSSLLMVWVLLFPSISPGAMIIRDYTEAEHYRFYEGSDKDFVGASYDFSGVGLGSANHWATLVSDTFFLSASHYHPGINDTVTFWTTNDLGDQSYTYTVVGGARIGETDLWVGWFDTSVDSSIARYAVPMLPTVNFYYGMELYNYGKIHRVGRNVLDFLAYSQSENGTTVGLTAWYDYDNDDDPSVGGDESYLEMGDSGAPSFTVLNSRLTLLGIHWAITDYPMVEGASSIDTFVPVYYDQVNQILARNGESLMAAVPEPGMFWYLMVTSGFLWIHRRNRRFSSLIHR